MKTILLMGVLSVFLVGVAEASDSKDAPVAQSSPSASESASPMPSISPSAYPSPDIRFLNPLLAHLPAPGTPISKKDGQALLDELVKAQRTELKALDHRHRLETQELKASQSHYLKEWDKREKEARHKFFAEHPKGAERRPYVIDFRKRGEELRKNQAIERGKKAENYDLYLKSIKKLQSENYKLFKKSLDEGKAPALDLWPRSGV